MKTCSKCGETKELSDFGVKRASADGFCSACKPCTRAIQAKSHAKHRAKRNAECTAYNKAHKQVLNAQCAKFRVLNPAYQKKWREKHSDYSRYQGRILEAVRRYRISKKSAVPEWFEKDLVRTVYDRALEYGFHVDHIVPLNSDVVCGLHCHANLQLLEPSLNRSKSNRVWPDMPDAV